MAFANPEDYALRLLPAFALRALSSGGTLLVLQPRQELPLQRKALLSRMPGIIRWEESGMVDYQASDFLSSQMQSMTVEGYRALRGVLEDACRRAVERSGSGLWIAGRVAVPLLEAGHTAQALYGETYWQAIHKHFPVTTLCSYLRPVDEVHREGLRTLHDAELTQEKPPGFHPHARSGP